MFQGQTERRDLPNALWPKATFNECGEHAKLLPFARPNGPPTILSAQLNSGRNATDTSYIAG